MKSAKHREIARERHEAIKTGTLPEWCASRKATRAAGAETRETAPAPTPVTVCTDSYDAPYTPSPEFTRAYSQVQPEAAVWDDRGYCRWLLPTCSAGSRLAVGRTRPTV
jgi:hypothetical protein